MSKQTKYICHREIYVKNEINKTWIVDIHVCDLLRFDSS